ncbi:alpha-L-glutamate ligase [Yinghuangia sp. ASG 101]|uniref:ATP-grasp domain-containing protein n=1 Tax=Yinghuangia sp. ASG 101 TaxID=2896848 RepID=UPI001E4E8D10|nr:alpha-L-glutamate ligase [Yinghuangia sp. ASG 101]UGQ15146.1 alpha-L-glutamate ligase [Yinghuangia sp. ASG 101]
MRVRIVGDRPDHPTLAGFASLLRADGHHAEFVPPTSEIPDLRGADLYLLKTRVREALPLWRRAEAAGIPVLNSVAATEACLDRAAMARIARAAGLPFPETHTLDRAAQAATRVGAGTWILKSRYSNRDNPHPETGTAHELARVDWSDEPVVAQRVEIGDGWDHKFWVVGDRSFAGLRRPPRRTPVPKRTVPVPWHTVPAAWRDIVHATGRAFGLTVYGVDIIATAQGPRVVDVNAFPGLRSIPDAPRALADLVVSALRAREP